MCTGWLERKRRRAGSYFCTGWLERERRGEERGK